MGKLVLNNADKFSNDFIIPDGKILIPKGIIACGFLTCWQEGYTGKDIIVAIIDTGIDKNQNSLKDKVIKSFSLSKSKELDNHGTHIAGIIAGNGSLRGGAYNSHLLDIQIVGDNGGTISNVIKGIGIAITHGANVINISLGGNKITNNEIQELTTAIQQAWNNGCICVSASGNSGISLCTIDEYEYPASIEKVESVTACNISDNYRTISLAKFSNENNRVDLSAPGVNVPSLGVKEEYIILSGTSMAAAHVTAMISILAEKLKKLQPELSGSSFSVKLIQMLHDNTLPIPNCKSTDNYNSALNGKIINISHGVGFLRYDPSGELLFPQGERYYTHNGMYLGNFL